MTKPQFSHLDEQGRAQMVDVGSKPPVIRIATAEGWIRMQKATIDAIRDQSIPKGDVLSVARVAGILAAKRTGELIPLCHPLPLDVVSVDFNLEETAIHITATAKCTARTGVEMEALTAVSTAALTIYDMCKAVDKQMQIDAIHLVKKTKSASHCE